MKRLCIVILGCALLSGCIHYRADKEIVTADIADPDRLGQIELGSTSSQWLVDHFGEPNRIDEVTEDESVWRYTNSTRDRKKFHALVLLSVEVNHEALTRYNFAIVNDRIERYWLEHSP